MFYSILRDDISYQDYLYTNSSPSQKPTVASRPPPQGIPAYTTLAFLLPPRTSLLLSARRDLLIGTLHAPSTVPQSVEAVSYERNYMRGT